MLEKWLRWLLPAYVFLLPWQARYIFAEYSLDSPYYGGLSLYLTDALFALLALVWMIWAWSHRRRAKEWFITCSEWQQRWMYGGAAVCLFAFISLAWFPFSSPAFTGFWQAFEPIAFVKWLRMMQAVLLGIMVATTPIRLRMMVLALMAAALVQSIMGMQQFFLQGIHANTWLGIAAQDPRELGVSVIEYADQRWLRAYGMLPHPNILGGFLALGALSACAWFFNAYQQMRSFVHDWEDAPAIALKNIRWQIIASLTSFCLLFIGLLFTFSRVAWLGFASGWALLTMFLFLPSDRDGRRLVIWSAIKQGAVGCTLLFALSLMLGPLWTTRIHDESRLAARSVQERSLLLDQAEQVIRQHPLRGSGIGSYVIKIREFHPDAEIFVYQPVHNVWLLLWAELGAAGLTLFAGYLVLLMHFCLLLWRKKTVSLDAALVFSAVFSLGLMGYFEHFWWTLHFGSMLAAIWIGMTLRAMMASSRDTQKEERYVPEGSKAR